ncbi:hypothetical protein [Rhodobacter maris]|uniref:Uncharacterized protein n=1 Tax=Rhodobacter maris TaxID=446682 RepID=A0A285RKS9_9RHOB|nr:hypothetical protein SAMN05877831_101597 [Rhodobacter maris]
MIKIMSLFLIVMVGLALFGRLRLPRPKRAQRHRTCPRCGRPQIGPGPCPCTKSETPEC